MRGAEHGRFCSALSDGIKPELLNQRISESSDEAMSNRSSSKTAEFVQRSGVDGVFASGIPVTGGVVGCADLVFHDSPPLAGWASNARVCIQRFALSKVTSVTVAQTGVF